MCKEQNASKDPSEDDPLDRIPSSSSDSISEIQIPKMEVHHHPDLHHRAKPWKEYFLEFIIIFLAVTLGFFAETMRERLSENSKAKELAESLYKEVYSDSLIVQRIMLIRVRKEEEQEYFINYMRDSSLANVSDNFYRSFAWSFLISSTILIEPAYGMLNQIRNAGSLRYFKSINCKVKLEN